MAATAVSRASPSGDDREEQPDRGRDTPLSSRPVGPPYQLRLTLITLYSLR